MKRTLITLFALAILAYAGSFFELWRLPYQRGAPLTYHDVYRKLLKMTSLEEDMLEKKQEEKLSEQEKLFRKRK